MRTSPAVFLFDLDGVLIDSQPVHEQAWRIVLGRRGITLADDELRAAIGVTSHAFAASLAANGRHGLDPDELVAEKRSAYASLIPVHLRPTQGADAFLRRLSAVVRIGLCTVAKAEQAAAILELFGWRDLFEAVVGVDDAPKPKPDPAIYLQALERFGVAPGAALTFEDSPVGVEAAVAAGTDVIGVTTNFSGDVLRRHGAFAVVPDFAAPELEKLLLVPATGAEV